MKGFTERILRRVADRPRRVPDYDTIGRIERDLDAAVKLRSAGLL